MKTIAARKTKSIGPKAAPNDAALVVITPRVKTTKARGSVPDLRRVLPEEVARAIAAAGPHGPLIRFLFTSGARLSEVVGKRGVTVRQLDFVASTVRLHTLKRREEHFRVVPLPTAVLGPLAQRIMAEGLKPGDLLFGFSRQHAYQVIRAALLAAGVDAHRARPHALRHGHAFHVLASGAPLTVVQQALGHSTPLTTAIYLKASGADLREAYSAVDFG